MTNSFKVGDKVTSEGKQGDLNGWESGIREGKIIARTVVNRECWQVEFADGVRRRHFTELVKIEENENEN